MTTDDFLKVMEDFFRKELGKEVKLETGYIGGANTTFICKPE